MNWLKKLGLKLVKPIVRRLLNKYLSDEALREQAFYLNDKIDLPALNEVQEQQILEGVILPIGQALRDTILAEL
jgi:translation elongation factor EF-Ts